MEGKPPTMVFSSLPIYMDPPNWNQQVQQQQQPGIGGGGGDFQRLPQGQAPPRSEGGTEGPVRPVSMADRARLAKLPQPEPAQKCPRCDSTNTKFCYFNNYSLTQPRHFCKTCRRYWTRGGALRSVPVGGGCRRNKRSKASGVSVKSASSLASSSSSGAIATMGGAITPNMSTSAPQLPFMGSLHHLADYSGPGVEMNYTGMQSIDAVNYQVGTNPSIGLEQWRIQQFPFFGGMESASPAPPVQGSYRFDGDRGRVDGEGFAGQAQAKAPAFAKMEDSSLGLNLQRPYSSMIRNDQYWGGAGGGGGGGGNSSGGNGGGGNSGGGGGWMMNLSGFNSS